MNNQLIIIGAGETAQIAYEYFTHDSEYEVVAFCVEEEYLELDTLYSLPVIPYEKIEHHFPPSDYYAFVAISYTQLNKIRERIYNSAKTKGYKFATYISSHAFVWHNVEIGANCFIFENNVLQHKVRIGNNVILWSGSHINHRTVIQLKFPVKVSRGQAQ